MLALKMSTRALASTSKGVAVEVVGKRCDVALFSISESITASTPLEISKFFARNECDSSIRCTIVVLTAAFNPLPFESYDSFLEIANCTKPTIAIVDGDVNGVATELAMSCDITYASDRSSFSMNQVLMGSVPGNGGTQRLPRAVGKSLAMEMILSGEPLSAKEAARAGLISKVVPIHRLLKVAVSLADRAASKSSLIQPMVKEAVRTAFETSLQEGLARESILFECTFATRDKMEGMTAHFEGRKPLWKAQ